VAYLDFNLPPGVSLGYQVQHADGPQTPGQSEGKDVSGNGNNFNTFNEGTGFIYNDNWRPWAVTPQTQVANVSSAGFYRNPNNRDIYSEGATGGGPNGTTLNDHDFKQFTIEASVWFWVGYGFQTFVGRDKGDDPYPSDVSYLYFQKNGFDENALSFSYRDSNENFNVLNTLVTAQTQRWYSLAVVGDGSTVKMYMRDNDTGLYSQIGATIAGAGLAYHPSSNWTVGRGWFQTYPADWTDSVIDEVRISDVALRPDQFLGSPVSSTFKSSGEASYSVAGNWVEGRVPNLQGGTATFDNGTGGAVTLDAPVTVGNVRFTSSGAVVLNGSASNALTLKTLPTAQATILVTGPSATINAPVVVDSTGLSVSVASGSSLTLQSVAGPGYDRTKTLSVDGGGTVAVGSYVGGAVSVTGGSKIDLGSGYAIVSGMTEQAIVDLVKSGGLMSSLGGAYTTLAVFPNVANAAGDAYYNTFAGVPVTGSDVIVAYTYYGDVNLDGVVNGKDFKIVMESALFGGTGWARGDLNYDGVVDGVDLQLLSDALGHQGGVLASGGGANVSGGSSSIPEPGGVAVVLAAGMVGCGTGRRRR
jgi:hypothetical protein